MVTVLILCFLNTASLIGSISIEPHSLYQKRKARNFDNYKKAANGLLQFCIQLQLPNSNANARAAVQEVPTYFKTVVLTS